MEQEICTLDELHVGIKGSKEWCLNGKKDKDIEKVYFYDFTIPKFKIIIEYNGETYHPNPT
ncbi:MAG: hypothetical protein RBS24_07175 [Bacilli bacterium]|nr:hypothetical protein [Bacilli bacterium]